MARISIVCIHVSPEKKSSVMLAIRKIIQQQGGSYQGSKNYKKSNIDNSSPEKTVLTYFRVINPEEVISAAEEVGVISASSEIHNTEKARFM